MEKSALRYGRWLDENRLGQDIVAQPQLKFLPELLIDQRLPTGGFVNQCQSAPENDVHRLEIEYVQQTSRMKMDDKESIAQPRRKLRQLRGLSAAAISHEERLRRFRANAQI